ncbi:MAG: hypothetical protein JXA25_12805 [Anaerolineales bacterium]|nr:hypothetical protein [Anaerolineales bacterium]
MLDYKSPSFKSMRTLRQSYLDVPDSGVRLMINPHIRLVSLTTEVWNMQQDFIHQTLTNGGGTNHIHHRI